MGSMPMLLLLALVLSLSSAFYLPEEDAELETFEDDLALQLGDLLLTDTLNRLTRSPQDDGDTSGGGNGGRGGNGGGRGRGGPGGGSGGGRGRGGAGGGSGGGRGRGGGEGGGGRGNGGGEGSRGRGGQGKGRGGGEDAGLATVDFNTGFASDKFLSSYVSQLSRNARSPQNERVEAQGNARFLQNNVEENEGKSKGNDEHSLYVPLKMAEYEENYSPMKAILSRITRSDDSTSEESDDEQSKGNAKGHKNKSKQEREKAKEQRKKDKEQRKKDKEQNKKDKVEKGKKNKDTEKTDEEPSTQAVALQMENALDLSSSDFINEFAGDLLLQRHSRSPQVRVEEQRGKVARTQDEPQKFNDLYLEHPEANLPYIPLAGSLNNHEGVERPSKDDIVSELDAENFFSREKRDAPNNQCCGQSTLLATTSEDESNFPDCFKSREQGENRKKRHHPGKGKNNEHFKKMFQMHCVFNRSRVLDAEGKIKESDIKDFVDKRISEDWKKQLAAQYISNCTNFANADKPNHGQHRHHGRKHEGGEPPANLDTDVSQEGGEGHKHKHRHHGKKPHFRPAVGKFIMCMEKKIRKNCDSQYLRDGDECKLPARPQHHKHHKGGKGKDREEGNNNEHGETDNGSPEL